MLIAYDDVISHAVNAIRDSVHGLRGFILVLTPPGSSRGGVVGRLAGLGEFRDVEFLVYSELHGRLSPSDPRFKPMDGLMVKGRDIIDYIKGGYGSVGEGLANRRIVIVTGSTMEALALVRRLREALGEGWGSLKGHVLMGHLSSAFKRVLDDFNVKYPEFIRIHHGLLREDDAAKGLIKDSEGISLTLWRREAELGGRLARGVEAIRSLSPGRLGLGELARDFAHELPLTALAVLPTSVAYVAGLLFTAPVLQAVALASGLATASGIIGEFTDQLARRLGIYMVKEPFKKFTEKILGGVAGKGGVRDRFLASMGRLLKAVVEAHEYVNDPRFEGVVDDVALEWGLDIETFRNFINNMYKVATERLVTEDELNKLRDLSDEEFKKKLEELFDSRWSGYVKEVEERLDGIEEEIEKLRREVEDLIAPLGFPLYFNAESLGVEFRDGGVILSNVLLRDEVPYVHNPLENAILKELTSRRRGVVVIVGPKGVGKSVASKVALARLLGTSGYGFVAVEVTGGVDKGRLRNFVTNARRLGYEPLFYLDPSKPEHYPTTGGRYEPLAIQLLSAISAFGDVDAPLLMVLSNDQYDLVKQSLASLNASVIRVEDKLGDKASFLTEVAKRYNNCGDGVNRQLADAVASAFSDNYTVATVLAADWLGKNNCDAGQILKAIEGAKGKINGFIKDYIWYAVLGGDVRERSAYAERLAPLILAVGMLGPFPRRLAIEYLRAFGKSWDGMDNDAAVLWFTQPMHDTIQKALGEVVNEAVKCALSNCTYGGDDPNYIVYKIAEVTGKVVGIKAKNTEELKRLIFDAIEEKLSSLDWADARRIIKGDEDRHSLARLIGLAYTLYSVKVLGDDELVKSLSDWLMVSDKMPPIAKIFLQVKSGSLGDVVNVDDACRFISEIYEKAKGRGRIEGYEMLEAIGILAITKGSLGNCLERAIDPIGLAIDKIPYAASPLKDELTRLMGSLLERGMYDKAAVLLSVISRQNVDVVKAIYHDAIAPKYRPIEFFEKLSWAGKIIFSKALSAWISARIEEEPTKAFIDFVQGVVNDVCGEFGNDDVRCLYAKAYLYSLIAFYESELGSLSEAEKHAEEAVEALEELSKVDRDTLVKGLEDLLRLKVLFKEPGEFIDGELSVLRGYVYHHSALVMMSIDLGRALDYASKACEETRKIGRVPYVVSGCDLLARLRFINGDRDDAIKGFREAWSKALSEGFLNMGTEEIAATLAWYLASLMATSDLGKAKEEYEKHEALLKGIPLVWALVTGLMRVYGIDVERDFSKARKQAIMMIAPTPFKEVLECLEVGGSCEDVCKEMQGDDHTLCLKLIETMNNPSLLGNGMKIDVEVSASLTHSGLSLIEVTRFIAEGRLDNARFIAEHWREYLQSEGEYVHAGLWGGLAKSLEGNTCSDDCREALLRLFYYG